MNRYIPSRAEFLVFIRGELGAGHARNLFFAQIAHEGDAKVKLWNVSRLPSFIEERLAKGAVWHGISINCPAR